MGTADLYCVVEALPEVPDSLDVDLGYLGRESCISLFVQLREGLGLDEALTRRLKCAIRTALFARNVPDEILQVTGIPRTWSDKKMERLVKKLLLGALAGMVRERNAMASASASASANAGAGAGAGEVGWFVAFAQARLSRG